MRARWLRWAALGVAVCLVSAFVELSEDLAFPDEQAVVLSGLDRHLLLFMLELRRPWLNGMAVDLTALGSPIVVGLFTFGLASLLIIMKGDRRGAGALLLTAAAAAALTPVAKGLIERPRPSIIPHLVQVNSLSYPSGHSLAAAAVYLVAAVVLRRHFARRGQRVGVVIHCGLVALFVGLSRVYLGVHYPTDVMGGLLAGSVWAIGVALVLHWLDERAGYTRPAIS